MCGMVAEKEAPIGVSIQISTEAACLSCMWTIPAVNERPFLHMRGLGLSLAFQGDFDGRRPRGRVYSREAAARPPALRRSSSKSFGGLRQESSAELTLQLSHFLGTLLNKTYCQYT